MNKNDKKIKAQQLLNLAKQYKSLLVKPQEYNLFSVLRGKTDEVRLHSRFIADLLNPKGQHGLSFYPLKLFLEHQAKISVVDANYDFVVKTEEKNIDILMVNRQTSQAIILENKIYASDQEQQLLRYYNDVKQAGYKHISIIYLTPFGTLPSEYALKGDLGDLNAYGVKIITMSYEHNIFNWIGLLINQSAQIPSLRESLIQYTLIIREIAEMSNDEAYINELKTLLIETNSVDIVDGLQAARQALCIDALVLFWKTLVTEIKKEFGSLSGVRLTCDEIQIRQMVTQYLTSRTGVNEITLFEFPLKGYPDCNLCIQSERNDSLFIGVVNDPNKRNQMLRNLDVPQGYARDANWWPVYQYIQYNNEYWSLKQLNATQVEQLNDESFVSEFAKHLIIELTSLNNNLLNHS